jgi:hypothetical protein
MTFPTFEVVFIDIVIRTFKRPFKKFATTDARFRAKVASRYAKPVIVTESPGSSTLASALRTLLSLALNALSFAPYVVSRGTGACAAG